MKVIIFAASSDVMSVCQVVVIGYPSAVREHQTTLYLLENQVSWIDQSQPEIGSELDMPCGIIQNIAYNVLEYHNMYVVSSMSINIQQQSERYACLCMLLPYYAKQDKFLCHIVIRARHGSNIPCPHISIHPQRGRIHHCPQPRSPRLYSWYVFSELCEVWIYEQS